VVGESEARAQAASDRRLLVAPLSPAAGVDMGMLLAILTLANDALESSEAVTTRASAYLKWMKDNG
jgi:hypothetical protein